MNTSLRRARALGGLLLITVGGAGFWAGRRQALREGGGPQLRITATDRVPQELELLQLSDSQRVSVQAAIRHGRDRVLGVVDAMAPRIQAAMDSTDAEIRPLLLPAQRASFDSLRRANGPAVPRRRFIQR